MSAKPLLPMRIVVPMLLPTSGLPTVPLFWMMKLVCVLDPLLPPEFATVIACVPPASTEIALLVIEIMLVASPTGTPFTMLTVPATAPGPVAFDALIDT